MNISEIKVRVSEEDILNGIKEFVHVKGLTVDKIQIGNYIVVSGWYKLIGKIKFSIKFRILEIKDKFITVELSGLKAIGIPAIKALRTLILNKLLGDLKRIGISSEKDRAIVDIGLLIKDMDFMKLGGLDLVHEGNNLNVTLYNLDLGVKKLLEKTATNASKEEVQINEKVEVIKAEKIEGILKEEITHKIIEEPQEEGKKVNDYYSQGREFVEGKITKKLKPVEDYVLMIPDIMALILRLMKDKRVENKTKIAVGASIGYIILPTDAISDKIPIVGNIDDLAVVLFALNKLINDVPLNIILENWSGDRKNILVLKEALEYIKKFTKADKIDKFSSVLEALV